MRFRSAQARAPFLVAPSSVARRLLWCPLRAEPTHRAMPMRSPQPGRLLAAWWWKSHLHWIHRRRGGSCRCRRQRRPDPELVDAVRRKPRRLPPGLLVPAGNAEPEFPGTLPVAGDNLEITILRLKAGVKPAFFVSSEPHAPLSKGLGRGAIYASWKSCNRPQILGRGKRAAEWLIASRPSKIAWRPRCFDGMKRAIPFAAAPWPGVRQFFALTTIAAFALIGSAQAQECVGGYKMVKGEIPVACGEFRPHRAFAG